MSLPDACRASGTQAWQENRCYFRYLELAYPQAFITDSNAISRVQPGLSDVFRDYSARTNQFRTDNDNFIFELVEVCNSIPGACNSLTTRYCTGLNLDTTNRQRVCGCVADDSQCSSSCFAPYTIQRGSDGQLVTCSESRCIIDRVSIAAINSNGSINIRQACANCTEQNPCVCIFNADSTTTVGNAVPLLQNSCSSSTCTLDGQVVDCASLPVSQQSVRSLWILWVLLAVLLLVGLVCVLVSFFS